MAHTHTTRKSHKRKQHLRIVASSSYSHHQMKLHQVPKGAACHSGGSSLTSPRSIISISFMSVERGVEGVLSTFDQWPIAELDPKNIFIFCPTVEN